MTAPTSPTPEDDPLVTAFRKACEEAKEVSPEARLIFESWYPTRREPTVTAETRTGPDKERGCGRHVRPKDDCETCAAWRSAIYNADRADHGISYSKKLRAEIRVLQRRLRDANRGAEKLAWDLGALAHDRAAIAKALAESRMGTGYLFRAFAASRPCTRGVPGGCAETDCAPCRAREGSK